MFKIFFLILLLSLSFFIGTVRADDTFSNRKPLQLLFLEVVENDDAELFHRFHDRVVSLLRSQNLGPISDNHAEDIVSETYLSLLKSYKKGTSFTEKGFVSFVITILRSKNIDVLRKDFIEQSDGTYRSKFKSNQKLLGGSYASPNDGSHQGYQESYDINRNNQLAHTEASQIKLDSKWVWQHVSKVNKGDKTKLKIIRMYINDDATQQEIASTLKVPLGTVKTVLRSTWKKLSDAESDCYKGYVDTE